MDKTHSLSSSLDHNQIQHSERSDYDLAYNELIENGFTEKVNALLDEKVVDYLKGIHVIETWQKSFQK